MDTKMCSLRTPKISGLPHPRKQTPLRPGSSGTEKVHLLWHLSYV